MSAVLRSMERADLPFVHELFNDPEVVRYWFVEPTKSLAAIESTYDQRVLDDSWRRFVIDDGGRRCGIVELVGIHPKHWHCEFQIIVAPDAQGNGYAGKATQDALSYAFRDLNLHKVYLEVDNKNARAIHVYEKAGFQVEGVLKQEYFADGEYQDATRMAIFQQDFLARD
ncbi:GNAT family N-acetyltransferase [Gordonia sp. (in: high G+C Gram-positive bacteria)]|uniref:GNAT family N-acetyltransferase n=1 Tax=Gordonia sp. (in: high G+C Gram-positive bacteria) TaxID=84139 RepID=UPI0039E50148